MLQDCKLSLTIIFLPGKCTTIYPSRKCRSSITPYKLALAIKSPVFLCPKRRTINGVIQLRRAQPISLKSFRGLGYFPNKIARVYNTSIACPSAFRSWQVMRMGTAVHCLPEWQVRCGTHRICLLFCKKIPVVPRRFSQVYIHLCACYSPFPMLASAISQMEIGGNRRLVCQKAKRKRKSNGGAARYILNPWRVSADLGDPRLIRLKEMKRHEGVLDEVNHERK